MADLTKRQREIIESSARLIEEKGIQNLTIKRLAASMKISEPAIYRHFDSKLEILIAILEDFNKKIRNPLIFETADIIDPLEQIKSFFQNHIRILTDNPSIASVIFSEEIFQNDKRLSRMVFSIMKMRKDVIIDIIRKGQDESRIRSDISADEFSLILFGAFRLLVKEWRLSNHSFSLKERGSALLESLLKVIV
jgi:AcrR family transcriptional regulator